MQHHDETLAAYVTAVRDRPDTLAVVVNGSVAKRRERPDSDVDVYLVVTESAFAEASAVEGLSYVDRDVATYAGGYVDVKVVSPDYLRRAERDGDEPLRASLVGARVVWSRDDGIAGLVAAIPELPDAAWDDRAVGFVAQLWLYGGYFLRQGEQLGDEFLTRWAALHAVSSAGRALLAHQRILFPGAKYLSGLVAQLPSRPDGYDALVDRLLRAPTAADGAALLAEMQAYHPWGLTADTALSRFVRDNELPWLTRVPPPEFS